jgi:signal peptidase I
MAARVHRSRSLGLAAFLGLASAASGLVSADSTWIRGVYTEGSPRPIETTAFVAWFSAGELAARDDRRSVVVGTGRSMHPLYPSGTILVLRSVAYSELRRGQTALYRSRHNRVVAHVLVAKARDGWRTRGLNNRRHDMEPVVPSNLVGIVVAAFVPRVANSVSVARAPSSLQTVAFLDQAP